jgi:hypothetical protein
MMQADPPGSGPSAGQAQLSRQLVQQLVQAAVAAPSMHYTKPWRFRVRPGMRVIELHADPARMLPYADPRGRRMHIGCGATLFNLRLAAAVADRQPLPSTVLAELAEAAGREDAILHILDHDETVRMLHLASDAECSQLADPAYRAELAQRVGGQRDRDGIPDSALGPAPPPA